MPTTPGNALDITTAGLVKFDGTATFSAVTTTTHDVLVGAASNGITNVAPSATSGVPLVSGGASADPSFTTAVVAGGGTGSTTFNTTGVVISGSTTTTALASVTLTDGQLAIGSSTGNPAAATITAGTGITVTNGHNTITIAASGSTPVVSVSRQVFTSSGTYTPTAGMLYCIVEALGGGGAGGGVSSGSSGGGGGGGGAGGYCNKVISAASVGASQTVTIGAGGTGVSGNTGNNGGDTTFGAILTGGGGKGGPVGVNLGRTVGGAGGTATGGDFNVAGAVGGQGKSVTDSTTWSGGGASSIYGGGGPWVSELATSAITGLAASGFGAGGSGGCQTNNTNVTGGAGTGGIIIVTEYV
jgi:hypothetical protein